MSQNKIMLCCETCVDNNPEGCGHFTVSDLRIAPDKRWLCSDCWDEDEATANASWSDAKIPNAANIRDAAEAVSS